MKAIVNLYKDFKSIGGAEKVAIQLHRSFKKEFENCYLMGDNSYDQVNINYNIDSTEYKQFNWTNILKLRNCIVLSHHRKNTTSLYLINKILKLNIRLIHVAHNEFFNLKYLTYYPDEVIAVSQRVKDNLISYFKVDANKITVIYNGLPDNYLETNRDLPTQNDEIKILYGARITDVKGQIRLVKNLMNKIPFNIKIDFAGLGDDVQVLSESVKDSVNFKYIGFIEFKSHLNNYDFCMLFSSNEGLPLSLIEACSFKLPIICNDVGGNIEIVEGFKNGYILNTYDELIEFFNRDVPKISSDVYQNLASNARLIFKSKFREDAMLNNYLKYIKANERN